MNSHTDQQLLGEYARRRSEAAFSELVRRHVDFIHSAARRMVGDAHLAEDVTQAVFMALAQNACQLAHRPVLAGWLHRTAQNLAANVVRCEARRRAREQEVAAMNELFAAESDPIWEDLAPHLDAALSALNETDRDALLLRYFERKSAPEIAQILGLSDEAAQKRVRRAVERLREFFAHRGVIVGASGLVAAISVNAVLAAPVGLAVTISTAAALVGTAIPSSTALASAKIVIMTTLQKSILAAILASAIGTGIYEARQVARQQDQGRAHSQTPTPTFSPVTKAAVDQPTVTPRRPITVQPALAPPPVSLVKKKSAAVPATETRFYQLAIQKEPRLKLSLIQVEPYLKANGRNAASLLAAYRTTTDPSLLAEAMQNFPNDPKVGFEAAIQKDATPEERRQRLDTFMKADPENSLANYLSALDHFKAGEPVATVNELVAAAGKPQFLDYERDRKQTDEEAYLAAGYPPGEAKLLGNMFLIEPQLAEFRQLGKYLVVLADTYKQSGDDNSRQNALQMDLALGRRFGDPASGEPLLNQLVGISIERMALEVMDPASPYGTTGQTVRERLDQLLERKESIHVLSAQADPLLEKLSDDNLIRYHDQVAAMGEEAALKWMIANAGPH